MSDYKENFYCFDEKKHPSDCCDKEFCFKTKSFTGEVYDADKKCYKTCLHIAEEDSKNVYPGYSFDLNKPVDYEKRYCAASEEQISGMFNTGCLDRIRWIISNSFPLISDMKYLDEVCGSHGITPQDAVNATQAAIWTLTDDFKMGFDNCDNCGNVLCLYQYLMKGCCKCCSHEDIFNKCKNIKLKIDTCKMKMESICDEYQYGPLAA